MNIPWKSHEIPRCLAKFAIFSSLNRPFKDPPVTSTTPRPGGPDCLDAVGGQDGVFFEEAVEDQGRGELGSERKLGFSINKWHTSDDSIISDMIVYVKWDYIISLLV